MMDKVIREEQTPEYWAGKHVRLLERALRDGADPDTDFLLTEGQAAKASLAFIDAFNSERPAFNRLTQGRRTTITVEQITEIAEALSAWQATWLCRNPDLTHMSDEEVRRARMKAAERARPALELLADLHSECFRAPPTEPSE